MIRVDINVMWLLTVSMVFVCVCVLKAELKRTKDKVSLSMLRQN